MSDVDALTLARTAERRARQRAREIVEATETKRTLRQVAERIQNMRAPTVKKATG